MLFHHLSSSQTLLSANTYILLLRASIKTKNPSYARQVHGHLLEFADHEFDSNINLDYGFLFDYLVVTLAKCGAVDDAYKIACSLDNLSVHSCTALIAAYAECGYGSKSLEMYEYMKENGVEPNSYTFVALFKACGATQDLETGRFLHSDARRRCFTSNPFIINTLVIRVSIDPTLLHIIAYPGHMLPEIILFFNQSNSLGFILMSANQYVNSYQ